MDSTENIKCSYTELIPLHKLVEHPKNPNKHPDEQIKRLSEIIDYQGMRSPIVVSLLSGFITKGHGRLAALKKLGWENAPIDYQEYIDEAQEYADIVADNAISSWADLDLSIINQDFLELGPDLDIEMLGIKDFVIEPIEKFDPQSDEDSVPEVVNPITKRGDVWLLGDHRVMCGDSTMIDDVEKLMSGETMEMVYTDPPYGINEKGDRSKRNGKNSLREGVTYSDFKDDTNQYAIDAYNLCEALDIPVQVWWGANYYCHALPQTNNWCVWDKRLEDKQRDFNSDAELAFVKNGKSSVRIFRHLWKGLIKGSEHGVARVHPTQKPIALAEWCFSEYGDNIKNTLDLFLGSGSTLIACEKTNRKCYGMELDEKYCDVIVNRWQEYTGKEATLESNGDTYNSLKVE